MITVVALTHFAPRGYGFIIADPDGVDQSAEKDVFVHRHALGGYGKELRLEAGDVVTFEWGWNQRRNDYRAVSAVVQSPSQRCWLGQWPPFWSMGLTYSVESTWQWDRYCLSPVASTTNTTAGRSSVSFAT